MFPFLHDLNLNIDGTGRVFHGRGKCFPHFENVIIDYFDGVLVIILYAELDFSWWKSVVDTVRNKLPLKSVVVQKRYVRPVEMTTLEGEVVNSHVAKEGENLFELSFGENQNFGLFLDTAMIRKCMGSLIDVTDKKILNLFSYTCSLSVAAIKNGAKSVLNVDMSKGALSVGQQNHKLNKLDPRQANFLPYDILKSFNSIKKRGPFDLIICDPPSYQRNFIWQKDYSKLLRLMPKADQYLFCLNDPAVSRAQFAEFLAEHNFANAIAYLPWPDSFREKDQESKFLLFNQQHERSLSR